MKTISTTASLSAMYVATVATVRGRLGTIATLYGANALFGLAFTAFTGFFLASVYAHRPLFDRAVDGDLGALFSALREGPQVVTALLYAGVVLAAAYFAVSTYLTGGLVERLRDGERISPTEARRRFGAGAAAHFGSFLRVWLWSWLLWVPAILALGIGLAVSGRGLLQAVDAGQAIGSLLASLAPGLAIAALAAAAGDYARLLVAREPALSPRRAFFRGVRVVVTTPAAPLHFLSYVAAWLLASGIYVLATAGHAYAGAGGALALFVLRQALVFARVALRVGAFGGQQALLDPTRG